MAASVANTLLGGRAEVCSAGVEAWGQRASQKAILLMRRRYQVDLSSHTSTDLEHVHVGDFDFIVSMEDRFAKRLADEFGVPIEKIIIWNIRDPFIEGTEAAYESCLSEIEMLLLRVLKTTHLGGFVSLGGSIRVLRLDVVRWKEEVSTGNARGTLLAGIAGKAVDGFEPLLRKCLAHFLNLSGLAYEFELAPDFSGKSLHKLTVGEVAQSLDKLGAKFSPVLGKALLVRKAHKSRLHEITKLRNLLHHEFDEFAKDEAILTANTSRLLSLIHEELSEPFFQVAAEESQGG